MAESLMPSFPRRRESRVLNGIARLARDLNSYLWVADPQQVTFLCLSKEKLPKEMTPRSLRRLPALLAGIGARLTRRAQNTRLGLKHGLA